MSERISGTVKWFNNAKGFGFITRDGSDDDIFVHFRSIQGDGYRTLNEGQVVEFKLTEGPKGLQAEEVEKL
ncbi:MAG: cold shock domain protein CspD [Euryarchaeota archaeon TMED255]|nr:MAG: cold shock domain protein CspD [Euryarchaeota archaeon TMED255]